MEEKIKERSNSYLMFTLWNLMVAPTLFIIMIILAFEDSVPNYVPVIIGLLSFAKCYLFAVSLNMYLKSCDEIK